MIYRFDRKIRILTGFLMETQYKGRFLYIDPATGEIINVDPDNLYRAVGYPGATIWYRAHLPGRENCEDSRPKTVHAATLDLDEEGFLIIKLKDGRVISHGKTRRLVHMARDIERFRAFMCDQVKSLNNDISTLLDVHKEAVSPDAPRIMHPEVFFDSYPEQYITSRLWFVGLLVLIIVACVALPDAEQPFLLGAALTASALLMFAFRIKGIKNYDKKIDGWEQQKITFDEKQQDFIEVWEKSCASKDNQETTLALALDCFDWPRETNMSFEFKDECKELHLDMDLPSWEYIPCQTWKVGRDKVTLDRGTMHPYERRERYVRHVHSLTFLAASIAFWSTPGLDTLYLSTFCENYVPPNPEMDDIQLDPKEEKRREKLRKKQKIFDEVLHEAGTGKPIFLLSLKITRSEWEKIDFTDLDKLNPVFELENFEMRRELGTSTMVLSQIMPF